jgi:hypothetical protein
MYVYRMKEAPRVSVERLTSGKLLSSVAANGIQSSDLRLSYLGILNERPIANALVEVRISPEMSEF